MKRLLAARRPVCSVSSPSSPALLTGRSRVRRWRRSRRARRRRPTPSTSRCCATASAEMLRGDALAAKKSFRLACFGFLEQPVILAEGLVRLGLAEAALGDREAFVATFSRLAEVEERFAAYAPAALSADERRAFEGRALEWVTPELLRSLPSFAPLLARKSEVDLAELAPRERTRELEKRAAAEPDRRAVEGPPRRGRRGERALGEGARPPRRRARRRRAGQRRLSARPGARPAQALRRGGRAARRLRQRDLRRAPRRGPAHLPGRPGAGRRRARLRRPAHPPRRRRARGAQGDRPSPGAADSGATDKPRPRRRQGKRDRPRRVRRPPPAAATAAKKPTPEKPEKKKAPAEKGTTSPPVASAPSSPSPPSASSPAKPASAKLTAEEERVVAAAQGMLKTVENRDELRRGWRSSSRWPTACRRAATCSSSPARSPTVPGCGRPAPTTSGARRRSAWARVDPTQRFYYAVCLYESGDRAAAAAVAATGLEKLQRPPFVEGYLAKIRAAAP